VILWLLLLVPEVVPHVESFWPTSVVGWLGGVTGLVSLSILVHDRLTGRGKNLQSIADDLEDLDERVTDIENTDKIIDQTLQSIWGLLREIDYELRGVDKANGIKAAVRGLRTEIEKIHERNRQMDLLAARFKEMIRHYGGPERRPPRS